MKRLIIITVGKTHSGKTTFARELEQRLHNSLVIDQDNHAEFINANYNTLLPKQGPNTLKYAISKTILDYAVDQSDFHLILSNANRGLKGRLSLLEYLKNKGFISIIVNFDIPDYVLRERVSESQRSTAVFRTASTFEEVLIRQQAETDKDGVTEPTEDEAEYFFEINSSDEVQSVIREIVKIARRS
ncbi:AAA family ATPase [Sporosarcina sp. Marseille-Q4063]|uniref:AAA family ATPase n=1 Tax=Sporosarcina sp. Marseille-Q4063 TaxID=2810514 RepID=UPI001BB07FF7|nr:AAA family ATPase [Sporosarcina sp. Marseille-Q4063]QUW21943.1 AAA family ATPase [Sporosarcina sp. Marseille-Q4063]